MAIVFHCEHCGKRIEAPDNTGGKWGKCPACHNKVYIPGTDKADDLKLAPIDEKELARKRELMAETYMLSQEILREGGEPNPSEAASAAALGEKDLTKNIILFLRQMANGELEEAEQTAEVVASQPAKAIEILDRIALSEMPEPDLADIPPQVLSGFIRKLRAKIG